MFAFHITDNSINSKIPIIIWGASGHALMVADILNANGSYQPIGFVDDVNPLAPGQQFHGLPVFQSREALLNCYRQGVRHLIVGVGNCRVRMQIAEWTSSQGFQLVTAIHPRALIGTDVSIGPGTMIAPGAIINMASRIGANVIVNTGATVDHECTIEDGVHIGPGAHLGGCVHVKCSTWIGIGAVIAHKLRIGTRSIVGAGAVVVRDVPDGVVVYGVPARERRKVLPHE